MARVQTELTEYGKTAEFRTLGLLEAKQRQVEQEKGKMMEDKIVNWRGS